VLAVVVLDPHHTEKKAARERELKDIILMAHLFMNSNQG
jgi:hypothetical protein